MAAYIQPQTLCSFVPVRLVVLPVVQVEPRLIIKYSWRPFIVFAARAEYNVLDDVAGLSLSECL